MNSNFSFVEKIDKTCFKKLYEVERRAKTEPFFIGGHIRTVLEYLVERKSMDYDLFDYVIQFTGERPDLFNQMKILRDKDRAVYNYVIENKGGTYKPLPVVRLRDVLGDKKENMPLFREDTSKTIRDYEFADNFLRQIGNEFVHEDTRYIKKVFKKDYRNVVCALKVLWEYVRKFYNVSRDSVSAFSEDIMPISYYEIVEHYIPSDNLRTGCCKEFVARRYEAMSDESVGCSLIRQYEYERDNSVLLKRATDVFRMGDNCGDLLERVSILTNSNQDDSPFYLVAYDFKADAKALSTEFLSSLTFKERVSLCYSYAKTLSYFHKNEPPIYHRFLSSKSAYYADDRNTMFKKIRTALVRFEHAKIAADVATVLRSGDNGEYMQENEDKRYIAPEWMSLKNPDNSDWEKVDIFSLGCLFVDILMGRIGGYNDRDVGDNRDIAPYMDIICAMTDIASDRPDIESVMKFFEEKIRNGNQNF